MNHPIPAPRRPMDTRSTPACVSCTHRTCRTRRARSLPGLGGHRSEFSREHTQAAQVQVHNRHLLVYFGESTQSFWIATSTGLTEALDIDTLLLKLWPHTDPSVARPWVQNTGTRIPALV